MSFVKVRLDKKNAERKKKYVRTGTKIQGKEDGKRVKRSKKKYKAEERRENDE